MALSRDVSPFVVHALSHDNDSAVVCNPSLYLVETADKNEYTTASTLQGAEIANKSLTNGEEKAQIAKD